MAFANNMTKLLDKIERRLEVVGLKLPDEIAKNKWADIVMEDTMPTFSRYFPHKVTIYLDSSMRSTRPNEKNTYIIDEDYIPNGSASIIGFKDLNWQNLINNTAACNLQYGSYGAYDGYEATTFEDFAMIQMQADTQSLYSSGIYPEFEAPNKIKFPGALNQDIGASLGSFPIDVFVWHPNLQTIDATKMEMFERIAKGDVAIFLYSVLKYYDNIPTIFGGEVDLKLDKIQECINDRDNCVDILESQYVSAGNRNQPMIIST